MIADQFLFTWDLIPYKSTSQYGSIPRSCTYRFSLAKEPGILQIDMEWVDEKGKAFNGDYQIKPDGLGYEADGQNGVDMVMAELRNPRLLTTSAFYRGEQISFASREILPDRTMRIIQRGKTPQGVAYENVQYFRRMR